MRQQSQSLYGYLVRGWSLHPNITENKAVNIPSQYLWWFPWMKFLGTIINILPYSTNILKILVPAWVSSLKKVVTLFHGSWGVLKRSSLILTFFYPHVCVWERENDMCAYAYMYACLYIVNTCLWRWACTFVEVHVICMCGGLKLMSGIAVNHSSTLLIETGLTIIIIQ